MKYTRDILVPEQIIKKSYNDLVLGMEDRLRKEIEGSTDPLAKALIMARIGNYIDFGAMNHVDEDEFLSLFSDTDMRDDDRATYESFLNECRKGQSFLLVCDNCGEIVLDKLMLEQLPYAKSSGSGKRCTE